MRLISPYNQGWIGHRASRAFSRWADVLCGPKYARIWAGKAQIGQIWCPVWFPVNRYGGPPLAEKC